MKVGDLVRVASENNPYYGEIGIVTERPNDGFFAIVHVQSGEFWFAPESLEELC